MNDIASRTDLRLSAAAAVAFSALIGTILSLAFVPEPTGWQLQTTVTVFGIAILVALASIVRGPTRGR